MLEITDKKCEICGRGYLVRESWGDLYCNACFRRPEEDRYSRSGGETLEEPKKEAISERVVDDDEEEDNFSWYSWPDF